MINKWAELQLGWRPLPLPQALAATYLREYESMNSSGDRPSLKRRIRVEQSQNHP